MITLCYWLPLLFRRSHLLWVFIAAEKRNREFPGDCCGRLSTLRTRDVCLFIISLYAVSHSPGLSISFWRGTVLYHLKRLKCTLNDWQVLQNMAVTVRHSDKCPRETRSAVKGWESMSVLQTVTECNVSFDISCSFVGLLKAFIIRCCRTHAYWYSV